MRPNLWYGTDRTIQLRDIKIGRRGIVLNDPAMAEHNTAIFEKLNRKINEFRLEMYESHKMSAIAPLYVDLDCGHGIIYVKAPGVKFTYNGGLPEPYDVQNIVELRGSLVLGYVQEAQWVGQTVFTIEGARINHKGTIVVRGVGNNTTNVPKHGVLIRQSFQDKKDRQPWGSLDMISVEGGFEKSAVEIVSAEEIIIRYLTVNSLREGCPALHVAIDSDSRIKETSPTMTNFHVDYAHLTTVNNPVVEFSGFVGGQISLDAGIAHIRREGTGPHTLLNKGAHLRTLRYGLRHDLGPRKASNRTGIDAQQGTIERLIDVGCTHHDLAPKTIGRINTVPAF